MFKFGSQSERERPCENRYEHPWAGPASNRRLLSFGCA